MLQGVDHVHGHDHLPLGMLHVGDSVVDHILQEDLQQIKFLRNGNGLFMDLVKPCPLLPLF